MPDRGTGIWTERELRAIDGDSAGAEIAAQALQIAAKIGGTLVAEFAVFFQGFVDDFFEARGYLGIEAG